jgi:hypothetical protein
VRNRIPYLDPVNRLQGHLDMHSGQDLVVPVRSMHADPLPVLDQPGGVLHDLDRAAPVRLLALDLRMGEHYL